MERGTCIKDCVSSYPSVTPVASSSIATGVGPDRHYIPSMNWYHRGEHRYVEYGSSFQASRAFGIRRSLYDTVYNMNMAHLSRAAPTVYEQLEDAGLRTACTTFLIYRGRTRHKLAEDGVYPAIARAATFTHAVYGPTELFYADIFQSRKTGCTSILPAGQWPTTPTGNGRNLARPSSRHPPFSEFSPSSRSRTGSNVLRRSQRRRNANPGIACKSRAPNAPAHRSNTSRTTWREISSCCAISRRRRAAQEIS